MKGTMGSGDVDSGNFSKSATGIGGFDQVSGGGLPTGRTTIIKGYPGSGKTIFAMQFIVHGASHFNDPGVFVTSTESVDELTMNMSSFGFDLDDLLSRGKMAVHHVRRRQSGIEENDYGSILDELYARLGNLIDSIDARRVAIDAMELLFSPETDRPFVQAEIVRMMDWLRERGVTAVLTVPESNVTCESPEIEEHAADCVISLGNRRPERLEASSRLQITKYRGTPHGTRTYPFVIGRNGISVIPFSHTGLDQRASSGRVSTGIPRLDAMLSGKGYYRGSSILVSGTAGSGKSSVAAHFLYEGCRKGERCLYFPFEEYTGQTMRNMRSIGIDFEPWLEIGLMRFCPSRPIGCSVEAQCATMTDAMSDFKPGIVVVDSASSLFTPWRDARDVLAMMFHFVSLLKASHVTSLFTCLTDGVDSCNSVAHQLSPLMDTWIMLHEIMSGGECNHALSIRKSRGMAHSNQIREFLITDRGLELIDVHFGHGRMLTGTSRVLQEAQERAEAVRRQQEIELKIRDLERKRQAVESQVTALRSGLETEEEELTHLIAQEKFRQKAIAQGREKASEFRYVEVKGEE